MTELEDDMYHWDKYGDKHRGVRIGFTPKELEAYWGLLSKNMVFVAPVVYQSGTGEFSGSYAEEFKAFGDSFYAEIVRNDIEKPLNDRELSDFSYCVALTASILKREEWSLEREWRVISICPSKVAEGIVGTFTDKGPIARLLFSRPRIHLICSSTPVKAHQKTFSKLDHWLGTSIVPSM